MAPTNRVHLNVTKPMIAKNSTGRHALGAPVIPVMVRAIGTKDRHSKVRTAKGLRDRRVRLSAPTAIQFFEVQDRLGFDQPSKALDWLIKNARAAIDELAPLEAIVFDKTEGGSKAVTEQDISQETNVDKDVDEQHETSFFNVDEQQSSDFRGKLRPERARNRAKEKRKSDEVKSISLPMISSSTMPILPQSFVLYEPNQSSIQPLPSAHHHHSLQQSSYFSNITLPQPTTFHSVQLPTYSFHTPSESSSPLIFSDYPPRLDFLAPAAHHINSYCSISNSPHRGTLQSILSSSHLPSMLTMDLYGLMGRVAGVPNDNSSVT